MPPIDQPAPPPPNDTQRADDLPLAITRAIESVERGEPVPAAPATEPSRPAAAPPSAAEGGTQQPRSTDGRFASKPPPEGTAPAPAQGQGASPTAPTPAPGAAPAPATDKPPVAGPNTDAAPASWKDDAKAKWAAVPQEIRSEVYRRERELDRAMDASATRARAASMILDEFAPYEEILNAENTNPVAAIRTLLQTAYALRTSGPEYRKAIFLDLAQQYGVDLTSGINAELAQAQAQIAQHDIGQRTNVAMQHSAEERAAAQAVAQFAETHEHFPKVRTIMGHLISTGVCRDMETAYQQALVLSPEMRPWLIDQEVAKRTAASTAAAAQQQQNARRAAAASSVGNDPGGFAPGPSGAAPNSKDDLRGSIAAALDRVGGV